MSTVTLDTLNFANRLKAAGFSDQQVAAITELQKEPTATAIDNARHDYHLDELSTRRDLELVRLELFRDIREMELKLEAGINAP